MSFCSSYQTNYTWAAVRLFARTIIPALMVCAFSSCTLLAQSPHLSQVTKISILKGKQGLITGGGGELPYQRWRLTPWDSDMRYMWLVGNYDFRKADSVDLVLYFHGMHSKDYYNVFRKELEALAEKRPNKPFIFVGYVDTPYIEHKEQSKNRWSFLIPETGEKPEALITTINGIYKALKIRFPRIRKEKTRIVLAGFSGGGKVLDAVGNWLAKSTDDPWAGVLRARLSKIIYFDCWFDKRIVETVPELLESNPKMEIVGTVHMKKPAEHAALLADKYNMKKVKPSMLTGLDGRLTIFHNDSHWKAMITRLREAL